MMISVDKVIAKIPTVLETGNAEFQYEKFYSWGQLYATYRYSFSVLGMGKLTVFRYKGEIFSRWLLLEDEEGSIEGEVIDSSRVIERKESYRGVFLKLVETSEQSDAFVDVIEIVRPLPVNGFLETLAYKIIERVK